MFDTASLLAPPRPPPPTHTSTGRAKGTYGFYLDQFDAQVMPISRLKFDSKFSFTKNYI